VGATRRPRLRFTEERHDHDEVSHCNEAGRADSLSVAHERPFIVSRKRKRLCGSMSAAQDHRLPLVQESRPLLYGPEDSGSGGAAYDLWPC
jgi:hypothetical protein